MTGKLIFKMEMFKFFKDRPYLISAIILGIVNTILTLLVLRFTDEYFLQSIEVNEDAAILPMLLGLFSFSIIGNVVFMFIYPFHAVSIDYKNSVMAMMVASGVNRTKLYFSKIGAIFLSNIILSAIVSLIPLLLIMMKLNSEVGFGVFLNEIFTYFNIVDFGFFQMILLGILNYLYTLVLIVFASILLKGSNLTILVYIGLAMGLSLVKGILNLITTTFNFGETGIINYKITLVAVLVAVLSFLSLKILKKQNL